MANVRFLYSNRIDLTPTVISASTEVATLPAENVRHSFQTYVWRSTTATSQWIKAVLSQAYSANCVALINHNLTSGATVTYQSSNASDFSTLITDVTLTYREGTIFGFFTQASAQYHRIQINDASNPDGYVELGRLYIGLYLEPTQNFHTEFSDEIIDLTRTSQSEGGNFFADEKNIRKKITLPWRNPAMLSTEDKEKMEEMFLAVKTAKPLVLFFDYENEPEKVWYSKLTKATKFKSMSNSGWWEATLEFEEAL